MEISKFIPCSSKHNALAQFNSLKTTDRIVTLALTALATILSAGLLTTVIFRILTEKYSISKNLKPDSKQESMAKKIHSYQNNNDQNFKKSTFKKDKENESNSYKNPLNFRQELIGDVPVQETNLNLQPKVETVVLASPESEVPLIQNKEIEHPEKLLIKDDKKLFCEELEKDHPSVEILEKFLKVDPALKEELILRKGDFTKKSDLQFLKFLVEEIKLKFTYSELGQFIDNGWIEGLRYLAEKIPNHFFYDTLNFLFIEAEKKGLPPEIVDLFKPEASTSEWMFFVLSLSPNLNADLLSKVASAYPNFQIEQEEFDFFFKERIVPFYSDLNKTDLPLLKVLVENCGCKVNHRHLDWIKSHLAHNKVKEIFKYLVEKGAHKGNETHIKNTYHLAKRNNLDEKTLAALGNPEFDSEFAKGNFFTALRGYVFVIGFDNSNKEYGFKSELIKYWADEIISNGYSKEKFLEEIQTFYYKQSYKKQNDILLELHKVGIRINGLNFIFHD